jgi:hypothetical protein
VAGRAPAGRQPYTYVEVSDFARSPLSLSGAMCARPIFGGPAYYIRNVVYNTPVALKFSNPAGAGIRRTGSCT